ncbi:MAG: cohesin domain-containing protein, partial [Oscillospiraceae bacterium]|nr:cohesin domain-containing protein [Oscillospiraceae bacterium]
MKINSKNAIKKIVAIVIIVVLLTSVILPQHLAFADTINGGPTFSVGSGVSGRPGDTVTVPIIVTDNPATGFAGVGLRVSFDDNLLKLVDARNLIAELPFNPPHFVPRNDGNSPQWISLVDRSGPADWTLPSGTIVNLYFRISDTATPGPAPISLDWTRFPDGEPATASGSVYTQARLVPANLNVTALTDPPPGNGGGNGSGGNGGDGGGGSGGTGTSPSPGPGPSPGASPSPGTSPNPSPGTSPPPGTTAPPAGVT